MRRVISVFLPRWPMDLRKRRLREAGAWQPDKPFVIAALEGQQNTIIAVNDAAAAHGIAPGMALSRARVIYPDVKAEPASPEGDARALERLAVRALRYSPLVAPCPADGLWIDATGAAHLFGGEAAMVKGITRRLRAVGITARTAMAGTPGAAWAWARYGAGDPVLAAGSEQQALDALPVRALRLSQDIVQTLRHVGVKTIGELRRIPRATIPIRFGRDVLRRLDQALGLACEAITPISPPAARCRRMDFAEPIAAPEDLQRIIHLLTQGLCGDLEKAGQGALKLDLIFVRIDAHPQTIRIAAARPSRGPGHLAKLLIDKLPTVDPGFGIESAVLNAWRVDVLRPLQLGTDGHQVHAEKDLGELVDRLANRFGAANVFTFAPVASDIPERAVRRSHPLKAAVLPGWPAHWPRPMRLLTPPEPVTVISLLPDYPPVRFRWRDESHTVRIADGPERIFGEWWKAQEEVAEVRDYFRVENDRGERYWLFRTSAGFSGPGGQWYLHGLFP